MGDNNDQQTVGKFYTAARRFKQVLGSLPDGTKIPGGPYTYGQIGLLAGVLIFGWITRGIWGNGNAIGDFIILLAVAVGATILAGKLPGSRRKATGLIGSIWALIFHPGAGGHYKGRPLKLSVRAQRLQREAIAREKLEAKALAKSAGHEEQPGEDHVHYTNFGSSLNRIAADHGINHSEGND